MIFVYLLTGAVVLYVFYWLLAGKSDSPENTDRSEKRVEQSPTSFPRAEDSGSSPPNDANEEERRRSAIKNIMDKRAEDGNIEPSDAAKVVSQWMKKPPKKKP